MLPPLLQSLRFRIATVVTLLALLMLGAALHTLAVVREQRTLDVLLHTSGQLQLTIQTLEKQSLNYLENAPRDYPTYYRDVKLYYEDLKAHIATFDMFTDAFMRGAFSPEMTGLDETIYPDLDDATMSVVQRVEDTWTAYRKALVEKLGPDTEEPRLEWAAEFIAANSLELEVAADELASVVRYAAESRARQVTTVNAVLLAFYVAVSVIVVLWFFRRLIYPLSATADAFHRVSQGDFGHQIPVSGQDEIASLTASFNRLSRRIHGLLELTTRIQRGSNLDETLRFIAEDFRGLIPLDWVAMLFARDDGKVQLERAYSGREAEMSAPTSFPGDGGLLANALQATDPVHGQIAVTDRDDVFAAWLADRGVRDAILLPVREQTPQPGILVIASRHPDSYTADHLELIRNIGLMVSLSFARTVQLAERARLAAIGEFTSGIVHELRTPLATIDLALDYLRSSEMAPPAARRVALAAAEVDRMGRLLSDVLQYARPMVMNIVRLDVVALLHDTLERHPDLGASGHPIEVESVTQPVWADVDADRLTQVLINLTKNALEASPGDAAVRWEVHTAGESVALSVTNDGTPVPASQLDRLFEPFFTTKAGGTGLGLSIVKRIVEGHGGTIAVTSLPESGTRFEVRLPRETAEGKASTPATTPARQPAARNHF
jgi:signal transduction histidine kinase